MTSLEEIVAAFYQKNFKDDSKFDLSTIYGKTQSLKIHEYEYNYD